MFEEKEINIKEVKMLLKKLIKFKTLTFLEYKTLLEKSYHILSSENDITYNIGLSAICHVADSKPIDIFIRQLLYDCIVASRVFIYRDMYEKIEPQSTEIIEESIFDLVGKSYYTLDTGTVLTKDQKRLFDDFQQYKRLIVSAPTSFGKSRIIPEIIIHNSYKNIAIILPTIALLSETYQSFKKNELLADYNLINSLTQQAADTNNILIFTPEKMDLFLDQNSTFQIDFFAMDEIYKIQDDIERKYIFTHCLYRLSKTNCDFYLIGPYFEDFSPKFREKTNSIFKKFNSEIVQKDTFDLSSIKNHERYQISNVELTKMKSKDINLLKLVESIEGQSLVYVGNKQSVETRAKYIAEKRNKNIKNDLIDYIQENIDKNWSLVNCLKNGVAYHHSGVPKYIQTEIVDLFNEATPNGIDILVCSPTLTEGVNTSAKNVIIYDDDKGGPKLSGFDVKNIKGRAGRFSVHFVGNVITFEKLEESEKGIIEFSYFDNENLESEEAIQISKNELTGNNLELRDSIEQWLKEEKIPLALIKMNKFIEIEKQVNLLKELRKNTLTLKELAFAGNIPEKSQLDKIIELCFNFLFNEKDFTDKNFSLENLRRCIKYYIYRNPSLKELIATQNGQKIDTKIRNAFKLITKYFEFSLPKYITAFENIYNFVYQQKFQVINKINLKYLITKLEFGFVTNHEIALKEAGVPVNIINKISNKFKDCNDLDQIRTRFRARPYLINDLTLFEKKIFKKYV